MDDRASAATSGPTSRGVESRLARRDAILDAVARAAERLSEPGRWQDQLPEVFRILGTATRVSRVYLFEIRRRPDVEPTVSQRFEWAADGVAPQIDNPDLQDVPLVSAGYARWCELLEAGRSVFGDIEQFPESERPLLESQQILSILVAPVFSGRRWWGFVGFDACATRHAWEKVEVDALRIAALVLGSSIQRQEREAQLRETQKLEALGRMAGGVAHDFNNVLTVVGGGLELLRGDLEAKAEMSAPRLSQISIVEQALARAATLTRRLLEFSRHRDARPQVVSPLSLLRDEEPLLRQAIGAAVRLHVAAPVDATSIAPIEIDPTQFAQVLLNLAVNARDAMPRGGELVLELSSLDAAHDPAHSDGVPRGRWTMLRVVDTGEGMPPEVREHIFEPFFTTKPSERGTGLGLATVYGIVSAAGGRLAVTSAPGRGTEFRLYFPAVGSDQSR